MKAKTKAMLDLIYKAKYHQVYKKFLSDCPEKYVKYVKSWTEYSIRENEKYRKQGIYKESVDYFCKFFYKVNIMKLK